MENGTKKTIIWENNSEPPKNYLWVKDGSILEWSGEEWIPCDYLTIPEEDTPEEEQQ